MKEEIAILKPEQLDELIRRSLATALSDALPRAVRKATAKPYLTKQELMQWTSWSGRQIEYLKQKRRIPFVRRGKTVLFPTDEVIAYFEAGRVDARPDVSSGSGK